MVKYVSWFFSGLFGVQMCEFEFECESNSNPNSNPSSKLNYLNWQRAT
jgi:hypothetical protein